MADYTNIEGLVEILDGFKKLLESGIVRESSLNVKVTDEAALVSLRAVVSENPDYDASSLEDSFSESGLILTGEYTVKVDMDRGSLVIPAQFRRKLFEFGGTKNLDFYILHYDKALELILVPKICYTTRNRLESIRQPRPDAIQEIALKDKGGRIVIGKEFARKLTDSRVRVVGETNDYLVIEYNRYEITDPASHYNAL